MRLSDLLAKVPDTTSAQVEGFLDDRPLPWGKHKKIKVGRIFHNFHCRNCDAQRTFESGDELYCLGLGDQQVSIDATLKCAACKSAVEVWYLARGEGDLYGRAPTVRIDRYTENLRDIADRVGESDGPFADLVKRANLAYEAQLGAGSMIYLRKIFEMVTSEVAEIANIPTKKDNGHSRPFKEILQKVNEKRQIIPQSFSSDGYKLFGELSEVIHGDSDENEALKKFKPCLQLVLGVVEEVKRDNMFANAIEELGWNGEDIDKISEQASAI